MLGPLSPRFLDYRYVLPPCPVLCDAGVQAPKFMHTMSVLFLLKYTMLFLIPLLKNFVLEVNCIAIT